MQQNYLMGALAALLLILGFRIFFVHLPKAQLQKGLKQLGDMKGKSKQEIVKAIGQPKVNQRLEDGQQLSWSAGGYAIQMLFDHQDQFVKITQEVTT